MSISLSWKCNRIAARMIHALRVSLKRLRAFLQLLRGIDPHFPGNTAVKKIKPLFAEACCLRDLQIQYALLFSTEEKLQLDHSFSGQLLERIQQQQTAFIEFQGEFSIAGIPRKLRTGQVAPAAPAPPGAPQGPAQLFQVPLQGDRPPLAGGSEFQKKTARPAKDYQKGFLQPGRHQPDKTQAAPAPWNCCWCWSRCKTSWGNGTTTASPSMR